MNMKSHIECLAEHRRIPNDASEHAFHELDMVIYLYYNSDQAPCSICFEGRKFKPTFNYCYKSEVARQRAFDKTIEARRKSLADKLEQKAKLSAERRKFKTSLKPEAIIYSSYGYEQTNIDFFQVVEVKPPKKVVIRKIAKELLSDEASLKMSSQVIPRPNHFIDEAIEKRVGLGDQVKVSAYQTAVPWDGNPKYASWYG